MLTKMAIIEELKNLGLQKGMKILVHVALSKIGYLENGPETLISAIKEIITEDGVIVMPAYNSYGEYKPNLSIVNESFKNQNDIIRTNQLIASFAIWGNEKEKIAANIDYTEDGLSFEAGEKSTLARLYENNGWSLMLGTDYSTCTILHLAENRATWPAKIIFTEEYISREGKRIPFHDVAYQDEDFNWHTDTYTDFKARIVQHEYDHLEAHVFTDRISPIRKQFVRSKLNNIAKGKTVSRYKYKH